MRGVGLSKIDGSPKVAVAELFTSAVAFSQPSRVLPATPSITHGSLGCLNEYLRDVKRLSVAEGSDAMSSTAYSVDIQPPANTPIEGVS